MHDRERYSPIATCPIGWVVDAIRASFDGQVRFHGAAGGLVVVLVIVLVVVLGRLTSSLNRDLL